MVLEPGFLLNNRYRIIEVLGQGGMGSIYRAIDEHLEIFVAVKDNFFTSEEYIRQFRKEATILATLHHPYLPRVTDHFIVDKVGQYMVMDYIEGEDLRQRMLRIGTLPENEVVVIGAAICDALMYLFTRTPPVIHRDIKPGNVKINPEGEIFLVDFGLAKTMFGAQLTSTGARAMTPGFSPPEQYGSARTDTRTDIFSLGATLYSALTGVTPEDSLARAMGQTKLTPIRTHNPHVSKKLATAIEKALELLPEERYQTPEVYKKALLAAHPRSPKPEGVYRITPPPETGTRDGENGEAASEIGQTPQKANSIGVDLGDARPGNNIANGSMPIFSQKRRRKANLLFPILVLFLLVGLMAFSARQFPWITSSIIERIGNYVSIPALAQVFSIPTQMTSTETPVSPTATVEIVPTWTSEPTAITPIETTNPVIVVTSPTLKPTSTIQPIPTPLGGGVGQLAYASNSSGSPQVFLINSDGSDNFQVTNIAEGACQPDFSPDGHKLVFTSPCDVNTDYYPGSSLYIINNDGSGLLPLPTMVGGDFDPAWSPDGKKIAFTSLRNNNRMQIYIINLETYEVQWLSEKYTLDSQPSWSHDGKKLLYVSNKNGRNNIWMMDADGQNEQQISNSSTYVSSLPSWSTDGKQILVTQSVKEGIPRVVLIPLETAEYVEYQLGKDRRPMRDAVMSPDGFWIAYEGWEAGGKHNIYMIMTTGINVVKITNDRVQAFDPVWNKSLP